MTIKNRITCEQVRQYDMVDYLAGIGHNPAKIRGNDYWYLSPLRSECTPSFKVNRRLNVWYDHGIGKGGNFLDFAVLYYDCTIGEFLQQLTTDFHFQQPAKHYPVTKLPEEKKIIVLGDFILTSNTLLSYLRQRRIPVEIADKYCREIRYKLYDKVYYGIGFKNDSGGYEIRNAYFKTSSSPKDITTIKNGADTVAVFEGFVDFLSYQVIFQHQPENVSDFIVLNSLSFFEKAQTIAADYVETNLFLDNDDAGQNCSRLATSLNKRCKDRSILYKQYKDLNDWLTQNRLPP